MTLGPVPTALNRPSCSFEPATLVNNHSQAIAESESHTRLAGPAEPVALKPSNAIVSSLIMTKLSVGPYLISISAITLPPSMIS